MEKIRAFIAVPISDDVRRAVEAAENGLRAVGASVKWVKPHNVHLTLKFLGDVTPEDLETLVAAVRQALRGVGSFRATLAGLGTFPGRPRSPRVVWLRVDSGSDLMADLARRVEEACCGLGFQPEERSFRPHLTIGRVRRGSGQLVELAEQVAGFEFKPLQLEVDKVNLVRSKLSPEGPTYTILESFALERL